MEDKKRGISKNCGCELARPYVNDQTFTKMYSLSAALNKGTLFPELYLMDSLMYNKELYSTPKKLRGGKRNNIKNPRIKFCLRRFKFIFRYSSR